MLDQEINVEKREGKNYSTIPENIYQAEVFDINSEERPSYDTKGKPAAEQVMETTLNFQFTLLKGKSKDEDGNDEDLRGRHLWRNFVPTYLYVGKKGKNSLYVILEAILGRDITAEEEGGKIGTEFLNSLVGKQCRIGVKHKKGKEEGQVFANIESFFAIEESMTGLTDEEKEEFKIKKKGEEAPATTEEGNVDYPENPNPEDIPFD